ncbi:ATE1 family protein [Megaselia abdita]
MPFSIIQYYGKSDKGRCGYCRSTSSAITHSFHSFTLIPQDYQELLDRGWRRSGHYIYKPKNITTCCPCYTIKCNSQEFKLSKSHKKILKRMNKFLRDGVRPNIEQEKEKDESFQEIVDIPQIKKAEININEIKGDKQLENPINTLMIKENQIQNTPQKASTSFQQQPNCNETNPRRKKAKQLRLERKKAKYEAKGQSYEPVGLNLAQQKTSSEKTIREFIGEVEESNCHKLKVILVPSVNSRNQDVFELYKKYQIVVHRDPPEKPTFKQFERFLVKSPLKKTANQSSPPDGFGSFHQQYWLDEKLIAVGVLDILPFCVSSVYFFYDPDYSFLSLGTYSSLRELEFTQRLSEIIPSLKYYYMGFYIHNCPKMKYKGNLSSSYLLCPETFTWVNLNDDVRNLLDIAKYQRLNRNPEVVDANEFKESNDLDGVLVLSENRYCTYKTYIQSFNIDTLDNLLDMVRSRIYEEVTGDNDERSSIIEYGKLVGKSCAQRMLYLIVPD